MANNYLSSIMECEWYEIEIQPHKWPKANAHMLTYLIYHFYLHKYHFPGQTNVNKNALFYFKQDTKKRKHNRGVH